MAKIAELHNGTKIHFPDTMPDSEMDTHVRRHLGLPDQDPEIAEQKQLDDKRHKVGIVARAAHVEATNGVADAMQRGFNDLLGPISGLADAIEGNTPELIAAVNKLSNTVESAVQQIVEALHAPKDFAFGANGKPTGFVVRKGKQANEKR